MGVGTRSGKKKSKGRVTFALSVGDAVREGERADAAEMENSSRETAFYAQREKHGERLVPGLVKVACATFACGCGKEIDEGMNYYVRVGHLRGRRVDEVTQERMCVECGLSAYHTHKCMLCEVPHVCHPVPGLDVARRPTVTFVMRARGPRRGEARRTFEGRCCLACSTFVEKARAYTSNKTRFHVTLTRQ